MRFFSRVRCVIAVAISKALVPKSFTIISDDCWAGQLYKQLGIVYETPTVGLFIVQQHYLRYLSDLDRLHESSLEFQTTDRGYPVASLGGVEIHFMHFTSEAEAQSKYMTRYKRINRQKMFYKIDFGKPGYTIRDVERWNSLRLPNSIAFYPSTGQFSNHNIHNGVAVGDWTINGAAMFDISRKHFNVFDWLHNGRINNSLFYRFWNALLLDPTYPKNLMKRFLRQ